MPVCMEMVPNPGGRNGWPVHCDGGIHYVRPFNLGRWLAVVMAFAITPHIPRKKKEAAEQHHQVLPDNSPSSLPEFCAYRTKGRHSISNFSLTAPSNLISWCDQMLAVASDLANGTARPPGAPRSYRVAKNLRTARRSVPTIGE